MGAVETPNYVQAAGTFAGVAPPPAPIPASGVVAQQGFSSFTRNGVGDYTLGLELAIGFLEAEVRVQPGINQLVVIGGQVDPDTERVQVRCYDTLGNPADCEIFTVQVLKIAVGPAGQLPLPAAPSAPVAPCTCLDNKISVIVQADANNFSPPDWVQSTVVCVSTEQATGTSPIITGLDSEGGTPTLRDRMLFLNVDPPGNDPILYSHLDGGSDAVNQLFFPTVSPAAAGTFSLGPGESLNMIFERDNDQLWKPF